MAHIVTDSALPATEEEAPGLGAFPQVATRHVAFRFADAQRQDGRLENCDGGPDVPRHVLPDDGGHFQGM